jgi:digeranylgeranylglycerophospholipid reductase
MQQTHIPLSVLTGEAMTQRFDTDILIVGAGPIGSYLGWKLAEKGSQVLLLEARNLTDLGGSIEIFHMDCIRFDEFDIPHPQGKELIHKEDFGFSWSPDLKVKQRINYPLYVMHMPSYIQRLHGYAHQAGAEIVERARVTALLIEDGALVGVSGERDGEAFEARSRLVVDATGIQAAVRTRLPDDFGVENDAISPDKSFFVCLELRDELPTGVPTGSNSYLFHKAFWNKSYGDGAILGIGQPHSFENAWELHRQWREEYFGDPGKVAARRQGVVPYRRPPFSLVGNGFLGVGDSVCMTKPFSGEGVTSGYTACKIAVEVITAALEQGNFSREALWPYNLRYFRGQGAKFAAGIAQLPAVASLQREDVNYLFRREVIFSSQDFEELNLNYEIQMGTGKLAATAAALLWGVLTGQFSFSSLRKFLAASRQADSVKKHYLAYPQTPLDFPAWAEKARELWQEN